MVSNRTEFHVVPYHERWQITRDGTAVFELPTKAEAVQKAGAEGRLAPRAHVIIHRADGTIEEERSYGDDPVPPTG